jgi:hypothetical protein
MQTTIRSISTVRFKSFSLTTYVNRFMHWCDTQERNRFGWTAAILAGHGCILTIITVMAILLTGNQFIYWPFAIAAMTACLVTNLAAMPTKIIIPVFLASVLLDIVIIACNLTNGFDFNGGLP